MQTILNDISTKIDQEAVEALRPIAELTEQLDIPFFLVGAKARDIFFTVLFGIETPKETFDIDIAVKVRSWEEVTNLVRELEATDEFKPTKLPFRFRHSSGMLIDIIPFGEIESPTGKIKWPNDDVIMSTIGFDEALEYSMEVQLRIYPRMVVKICTPAAMTVLKLVAWHEKFPARAKDAQDIKFFMERYVEAGKDDRLYNEDADLHEEPDFDYVRASARILGRDVSKLVTQETRAAVMEILERETVDNSGFRLVTDMIRGNAREGAFEEAVSLLNQLKQGIMEKAK